MRIYLYHKIDRGYYESAHAAWRKEGGRFADHLLRMQPTLYAWDRAFRHHGCELRLDLRSSFLLPQTKRYRLPMPIASLLRGALWVTKLDPWLLQQDIIRQVQRYRPDVAFFPLGSSVWESTLRRLKEQGVKLVQWCGLPATTMMERDRVNLPYFDLIFQPANLAPGLRAAGAFGRIVYVPIGIDPEIHRPVPLRAEERARYGADVCFIGGLDNRFHRSRRKMIEYAIERGIDMKVWGGYRHQFVGSPILKCWQGQIWGEEQVKALCAAKIGLNFHVDHEPGELDRGANVRTFELAACGVFQLLQRIPGIEEFFEEDKEIVCFDSADEMIDKIQYYLRHENERDRIAAAARRRVLAEHTWNDRVLRMLNFMTELAHPGREKTA
ncbi:MAG: hypothetical protein D6704_04695 [Nitrospirae bacterium]|nr:MAG: hypothetical protein D6704_04695 [Nitrospirota bacterium]